MRILAVSKTLSRATPEALQRARKAETERGKQLFEQGVILEGYMDATFTIAYMLLECASVEEAEALCATYPMVQAGFITFEYTPLVGLPAIEQSLQERHLPLPTWWPKGLQ